MIGLVNRIDFEGTSVTVHLLNIDYLMYTYDEVSAVFKIVLSSGKEIEISTQPDPKLAEKYEDEYEYQDELYQVYLDTYTKWKSVSKEESDLLYG